MDRDDFISLRSPWGDRGPTPLGHSDHYEFPPPLVHRPPSDEFGGVHAVPIAFIFGGVVATVLVGMANLVALAVDTTAWLAGSRLDLFGSVWSGSPEAFAVTWIALAVLTVFSNEV